MQVRPSPGTCIHPEILEEPGFWGYTQGLADWGHSLGWLVIGWCQSPPSIWDGLKTIARGSYLPQCLLPGSVGQGRCWDLLLANPPYCTPVRPLLGLVSAKSLPDLQWNRVFELGRVACSFRIFESTVNEHGAS